MRMYSVVERIFIGAMSLMFLWSAPHWAHDALALWRGGKPGVAGYVGIVVGQLVVATLFTTVAILGRQPHWMDRFDWPFTRG
jgi:hypothetical protein